MIQTDLKVLVIAPQPFFTPRGTPFSVYYRALISSELGVRTDILTYGEGEDVDIPNVNIFRIPRFKFLGDVKIGPSFLKLFLDIFIFFKMLALLLKKNYKVVHAHEEAVFFGYLLKPLFKFKLIYDMHSSLPQQLINFKFTTSKVIIKLFESMEVACLRSSDAVITICPDLYNYVNTIITDKSKHFLIENSIFDPVKLSAGASAQKSDTEITHTVPENKKLIVYAGTLEKYQGIEILIRSLPYVLQRMPEVFLLIVGGTQEQVRQYRELSNELKLSGSIYFTGIVSQAEAKRYASLADVLVSPRSHGTNTPLKIYEQLSSGKPLVATNIYSHTQVLGDEVAFLVEPEPVNMADGLIAALGSNGAAKEKSNNAKRLYEEKYSRVIYKEKLKNLFELIR